MQNIIFSTTFNLFYTFTEVINLQMSLIFTIFAKKI